MKYVLILSVQLRFANYCPPMENLEAALRLYFDAWEGNREVLAEEYLATRELLETKP